VSVPARDNRLFVGLLDGRLVRREEARSQQHTVRTERQRRREAGSVDESSCGEDGQRGNSLDDLAHDHGARDLADVPPTLEALGDDHVGAGVRCTNRVFDERDHVHHLAAALMRPGEDRTQVLVVARPGGGEHLGLQCEDFVDSVLGRVQQEVDPERLRRQLACPLHHLVDVGRL
jgi:hypothetical protein